MNNKIVLSGLIIVIIVVALVLFLTSSKKPLAPIPASMITVDNPTNSQTSPISPTHPFADRKEVVISVKASGFSPKTIKIKKGTIAKWVNQSGSVASIYSNNHPKHLGYPPLNLGQFTNASSLQFVFTATGTYGYHDHLNPNRTGEVIVE